MKKALISPNENVYIQNKETLQFEESSGKQRIVQVVDSEEDTFEVANPLFWIDCDDDTNPTATYYDPNTSSIVALDELISFSVFVGNTDNITENKNFGAGDSVRVSLIDESNTILDSCSVDWVISGVKDVIDLESQPKVGNVNFSSGRADVTISIKTPLTITETKQAKIEFLKNGVVLHSSNFNVSA